MKKREIIDYITREGWGKLNLQTTNSHTVYAHPESYLLLFITTTGKVLKGKTSRNSLDITNAVLESMWVEHTCKSLPRQMQVM